VASPVGNRSRHPIENARSQSASSASQAHPGIDLARIGIGGRLGASGLRETPVGPDLRQALKGEQPQRTTPAPSRSARSHAAQHRAALPWWSHNASARRSSGVSTSSASDGISSRHSSMPAFDRTYSCSAREFAPRRVAMPNGGAIASALVPVPSRDGTSTAPRPAEAFTYARQTRDPDNVNPVALHLARQTRDFRVALGR